MDIKLNRMDVKPNRPVRVGNQMMRSGEGGTEFHEQVDAVLAEANSGTGPLPQFAAEFGEALSAVNARVDDLQTQLQEVAEQIAGLTEAGARHGSEAAQTQAQQTATIQLDDNSKTRILGAKDRIVWKSLNFDIAAPGAPITRGELEFVVTAAAS